MSADATLAGMPLSVPWSVQYSFLRGHSRMEVSVDVSDIYNVVIDLSAYYFLIVVQQLRYKLLLSGETFNLQNINFSRNWSLAFS